jgi:hypothetical protein
VDGAVYKPVEVMVPPVHDQVTAVLLVPTTLAVNVWVVPTSIVVELGLTVTVMAVLPAASRTWAHGSRSRNNIQRSHCVQRSWECSDWDIELVMQAPGDRGQESNREVWGLAALKGVSSCSATA